MMASPSRPPPPAGESWTETDQEIIESLLMVDGSARPPTQTETRTAPVSTIPVLAPPARPPAPMVTAVTTATVQPHVVVPVAYWVPTPPAAAYYAHPHTAMVQPTFFAPPTMVRQNSVEMELQEMLSEEERKAKHREVQRRFVQRKKDQMDRIRREAATLEKRLSYLKLNQEQRKLEEENADLQDQIDDEDDVRIPTIDEVDSILEAECQAAQKAFVAIDEDAFSGLLQETMGIVHDAVIKDPRTLDDQTKVQFMGWTGRRVLASEGDDKVDMRCEITKQLARVEATDLVDRAWAQINDPIQYRNLLDPSLLMKVIKLQHVNDDAVVFFKVIINPQTAAVHHSVDLFCRIRRNDEMLIVGRTLDTPTVQASIPETRGWGRSLFVLQFGSERTPSRQTTSASDGTSVRYSCCMQGISEANMRFWVLEMLFAMVRFETTLVAPLFTLVGPSSKLKAANK